MEGIVDFVSGVFEILVSLIKWVWNGSEKKDPTWKGRSVRLAITLAGLALIGGCVCLILPTPSVLEKCDKIKLHFDQLGINRKTLMADLKQHPLEKRVEVPYHLRKRFLILTDEQLQKIDAAYLAELEKLKVDLKKTKYRNRAEGIAARIQAVMDRKPSGTVYLLDTDEFQAFCLPGGSIILTKGLMDQFSDDDELAFVIGHEYAHFLCRHTGESITKSMIAQEFGETFFFKEKPENDSEKLKTFVAKLGYRLGVLIGIQLPYSRTMELEADRLGVLLMKRAGFNTNGALKAMNRIAATDDDDSSKFLRFLSTHPAGKKRVAGIRQAAALAAASDAPAWGSNLTVVAELAKVAAIKKWLSDREKKTLSLPKEKSGGSEKKRPVPKIKKKDRKNSP